MSSDKLIFSQSTRICFAVGMVWMEVAATFLCAEDRCGRRARM